MRYAFEHPEYCDAAENHIELAYDVFRAYIMRDTDHAQGLISSVTQHVGQ